MSLVELSQVLGNFGEFIGAIAVVITLVYLALQVRENTRAVMGATQQALNDNHQYELHWACEIAELSLKSNEGAPAMTPVEAYRMATWLLSAMLTRENAFDQYRRGLIDEEKWQAHVHIIENILSSPWRRQWWDSDYSRSFTPEFRSCVQSILESEGKVDWGSTIGSLSGQDSRSG